MEARCVEVNKVARQRPRRPERLNSSITFAFFTREQLLNRSLRCGAFSWSWYLPARPLIWKIDVLEAESEDITECRLPVAIVPYAPRVLLVNLFFATPFPPNLLQFVAVFGVLVSELFRSLFAFFRCQAALRLRLPLGRVPLRSHRTLPHVHLPKQKFASSVLANYALNDRSQTCNSGDKMGLRNSAWLQSKGIRMRMVCVCGRAYMYIYIYMCVCMCVCVHVCARVYARVWCTHAGCMHACSQVCANWPYASQRVARVALSKRKGAQHLRLEHFLARFLSRRAGAHDRATPATHVSLSDSAATALIAPEMPQFASGPMRARRISPPRTHAPRPCATRSPKPASVAPRDTSFPPPPAPWRPRRPSEPQF